MKKIEQNEKIKSLVEIYAEFIKLCEPNSSGIEFSDLYMQDRLGWDTYIKYYFLIQGLHRKLFVLTAFNTRSNISNNTYSSIYENKIRSIKEQAIGVWKDSSAISSLSHGLGKKPSELMLDLSWYDIITHRMILGMELEQSRQREDIRLKDIIFDFYKLLYINSELKIMVSFPWQHQVDDLVFTMKEIVSKVSTAEEGYYLIINISENKNRGKKPNRKDIDYEISGFILNNKSDVLLLEKCKCSCLWKNKVTGERLK